MSPQKSPSTSSSSPLPSSALDLRLPPSPPQSPKRRSPPPTISPVDRVLSALQPFKSGRLPQTSRTFALKPSEFELLQRRIGEDSPLHAFYQAKVHWEYEDGRYTLRMPSATHEIFTARVVDAIADAVSSLGRRLGGRAEDALNGVSKGGSPTLKLSGPAPPSSSSQERGEEVMVETWRSPDGCFFHEEAMEWPGVVLEVAYSQQGGKLERIAEGYVVDSFGGVRCVVGLELPYKRDPKVRSCALGIDMTAKVSVWRPKVEKGEDGEETLSCACDVNGSQFIAKNGRKMEGKLELGTKDLLPPQVLETLDAAVQDESICIPFRDLCAFYSDASRAEEALKKEAKSGPKAGMKRRKRKRTPEEEMDEERECKFQRLEEADLAKQQDRAWKGTRGASGTREPERRSARLSLRGSAAGGAEKTEPS